MNTYSISGLIVASAIPLPEATIVYSVAADVTIRRAAVDWVPSECDQDGTYFSFSPISSYLHWAELGTFAVHQGREIIIDAPADVEERLIRLPLLGIVMAVLLQQRGRLVLHASSAVVDGQAVVFLGNKGYGKSTMAATLYARGHSFIADDLVALELNDPQRIYAQPGIPVFKLWPASVTALGDDPERLPMLATGFDKRSRRVTERVVTTPVPLTHIYILAVGPVVKTRRLLPVEAFAHLMAHTYVARFGTHLLNGATAIDHLRQCEQVLRSTPVSVLERPRSLDLLPDIACYLEAQLSHAA